MGRYDPKTIYTHLYTYIHISPQITHEKVQCPQLLDVPITSATVPLISIEANTQWREVNGRVTCCFTTMEPHSRQTLWLRNGEIPQSFSSSPWRNKSQPQYQRFAKCHWALISLSVILIWIHTWLLWADEGFTRHRAPIMEARKPVPTGPLKWTERCLCVNSLSEHFTCRNGSIKNCLISDWTEWWKKRKRYITPLK